VIRLEATTPTVTRLRLHPIKGLPPADVAEARVLQSGALALDRRWALVDGRGRFVNGKNYPGIHLLQAVYDLSTGEVAIGSQAYSLHRQGAAIAARCAEILGTVCTWTENADTGFPDDLESPGPTFVTEGSIAVVAGWFGVDLEATRRRFRANIEIGGTEAFWEDHLYGRVVAVGGVRVESVNPCARCVVPSRDAVTGEVTDGFQKRFAELRRAQFPADASTALFDHYYRFTVNTRIAASESGKAIRIGDRCQQV
jgi:uncharacterized protein YcbX